MKPLNLPYTTHIIIVAVISIIGAIVRKEYGMAGHWITVGAIGYYLLVSGRDAIRAARGFKALLPREKAHVVIYGVILLLLIQAVFSREMGYFTLLALLAVDYLLIPAEDRAKDGEAD